MTMGGPAIGLLSSPTVRIVQMQPKEAATTAPKAPIEGWEALYQQVCWRIGRGAPAESSAEDTR